MSSVEIELTYNSLLNLHNLSKISCLVQLFVAIVSSNKSEIAYHVIGWIHWYYILCCVRSMSLLTGET